MRTKEEKGITLAVLVITVILLLILAGVAVSMITGEEGLFSKANTAAEKYSKESAKESLSIALTEASYIKYSEAGLTYEGLTQLLQGKGMTINEDEVSINGYKFKIDIDNLYILEDIGKSDVNTTQENNYTDVKYLYNNGDLCVNNSGGWYTSKQQNTTVDIDNYDYMKQKMTSSIYCLSTLETVDKIDVSNYNYLIVDIDYETCISGYELIMGLSSYKNQNSSDIGVWQDTAKYGAILNETNTNPYKETRHTFVLDITGYTGEWYIFIGGCVDAKTYSVYLSNSNSND